MATSSSGVRKGKDGLRHEILSYKPGKNVPCDDDRVVFPDKLVIGMICPYVHVPSIVRALRRTLHGDVEPTKLADKHETSTEDQEEYLTDSISVITNNPVGILEDVQDLAGKVGCMVLFLNPVNIQSFQQWFRDIKGITGHAPLCAILPPGDIPKARNELMEFGITAIYEVVWHDHISSDEDQLQWLDLLHGCLQEGDRALAIGDLKKICTNPRCKLLYEKTKKEAKEANQKMLNEVREEKQENRGLQQAMKMYIQRELQLEEKLNLKQLHIGTMTEYLQKTEETAIRKIEQLRTENEDERAISEEEKSSLRKKLEFKQRRVDKLTEIVGETERKETILRQQVEELNKGRERDRARFEEVKLSLELSLKKEHDYNAQLLERLERETLKLRTKVQQESGIRSAEQKKKADTPQLMASGNQAQGPSRSQNFSTRGLRRSDACHPLLITGPSRSQDFSARGLRRSDASKLGAVPPDDEFAHILQQIADDLFEEAKIESLGQQLGIIQGDIQRALMSNTKFNRVTSDGTRHLLKQWRIGVSREDERMELTKALRAAKLVNLADRYLSKRRHAFKEQGRLDRWK